MAAGGLRPDVRLGLRDRLFVGLRHQSGEPRLAPSNLLLDVAPPVDVKRRALGIGSDEQRVARLVRRLRAREDGVADAVTGDPEDDQRTHARGDAVVMTLRAGGVKGGRQRERQRKRERAGGKTTDHCSTPERRRARDGRSALHVCSAGSRRATV